VAEPSPAASKVVTIRRAVVLPDPSGPSRANKVPSSSLLEVGEWGMRQTTYDDLELVRDWRGFLEEPGRWLRHLVQVEDE
jgi:hypothetical protein